MSLPYPEGVTSFLSKFLAVAVFAASMVASASDLSKTLIAASIADHLTHVDQGIDLISEFALSSNDVHKLATEIRGGAYEDFKRPGVKMLDDSTLALSFGAKTVKVSFKTLEREEIRVNGKVVDLKGSKTYANYATEIDKILKKHDHRANEMTGVLAIIAADVGYRVASSSLRDYGGAKARSAASEEKNLAADIIGYYRADHARCVRAQHDAERETGEFCASEKFHPECLVARQLAEQNCEGTIEAYFVCKDSKVLAAGTWDNEKKVMRVSKTAPSVEALKHAFTSCCEEDGCYKAVRHDLVDLYRRQPASEPSEEPPAPGSTTLPVPVAPSAIPGGEREPSSLNESLINPGAFASAHRPSRFF